MKPMRTKNVTQNGSDDLRPEYDLSQLKGGVRGKYFRRATAGTTLVLLEPDVAEAFPDAKTVNQALRVLAKIAQTQVKTVRTAVEPRAETNPLPRQIEHKTPTATLEPAGSGQFGQFKHCQPRLFFLSSTYAVDGHSNVSGCFRLFVSGRSWR